MKVFDVLLAFVALSALLLLATVLRQRLGWLRRLGLPQALTAGLLGLLVGPFSPWSPFPQQVYDVWSQTPGVLIALVFASLFLGQRLPSARVLWQRAASQTCFGLVLGFGQYLVGGVLVLLVLQPLLGVNPLMACLIEVGFEGGHGTAAGMGPTFDDLGLPAGEALGLAMATVGVLAAVLVGSTLVVIGRSLAWLQGDDTPAPPEPPEPSHTPAAVQGTTTIDQLTVNLALTGAAVVSARLQGSIGSLAMDLLITAAMASLNLPLLEENWLAFALLALVGLLWNLAVVVLLAPRMFRDHWFERAIADFG